MQHRSIYISSPEPRSGSLMVAIGLMEMLKGNLKHVAFFRPILPDGMELDESTHFMIEHFKLKIDPKQCHGFYVSEVTEAFANDREDEIYETLIAKVSALQEQYDFVLIEGYPRNLFPASFDFDINLKIAKNLNSAFIPVLSAKEKSYTQIYSEIRIVEESIASEGCTHLATFVNRCDPALFAKLSTALESAPFEIEVYLFPEVDTLNKPTLQQVVHRLQAKPLLAHDTQLQALVYDNKIAAMSAEHYITHIQDGDLVIVPGDRTDILLVSILSHYAKNHPNITAMILSGNVPPGEHILKLIQDFKEIRIPLFLVKSDSYETAIAVEKIPANITPESTKKIVQVKSLFDKYVDKEKLIARYRSSNNRLITPMMFEYRLLEQAKQNKQTIVLPEAEDERILMATDILLHRDIVDVILLGDPEKIRYQSRMLDIDIDKATIIDPSTDAMRERFAQRFYEMRKAKGLTLQVAQDAMTHLNYFATMMVYEGLADGMVSGAVHTTADTIRPALQIIKTEPDISVVSSVFFMCLDTRVLVYGDCAINLDPTAEELAQIAISSAKTAQQFGIEPRVALLSYSSGDSGSGPEVEKVRKATRLAQQMRPDLPIEGPMQYDAAIDPEVAKKKLPQSKIAGRATVFVFPDLNTGNNTYKAVQRSTGALAIGPVLQGLRLPVNDLSRGCSVDDIVNTVAITAIQAQQAKR